MSTANQMFKKPIRIHLTMSIILLVTLQITCLKPLPQSNTYIPSRELSRKHSLDVLKNLENEDFMKDFDKSDLNFENDSFWKDFDKKFEAQNQQMQKRLDHMQKRLQNRIKRHANRAARRARRRARRARRRRRRIQKRLKKLQKIQKKAEKNVASKGTVTTSEGPETKTVVFTDKNGNKVIEKSSHSSKKIKTKNGFTISSSTNSSINTVSPRSSFFSINSGGNGVMVANGKVVKFGEKNRPSSKQKRNDAGDFERFFGKMNSPFMNHLPRSYYMHR